MAAYGRVYDTRHLQADCQEPGSAPEPYARQSNMAYLYLFLFSAVLWAAAPGLVAQLQSALTGSNAGVLLSKSECTPRGIKSVLPQLSHLPTPAMIAGLN